MSFPPKVSLSLRHGLIMGRRPNGQYRICIWWGGITIPVAGGSWCFRPPWNRPYFSERFGLVQYVFRLFGFRLFKTLREIGE